MILGTMKSSSIKIKLEFGEIALNSDISGSAKLYLKLYGLRITNSVELKPTNELNIELKRNYLANILGLIFFLIVVLSPLESVYLNIKILNFESSFLTYAVLLILGDYLMSLKKIIPVK